MLLETVYRAFDDIASKRRVFKVETIGGESSQTLARAQHGNKFQ